MLCNYGTCIVMFNQRSNWDYVTGPQNTVLLTEYTGTNPVVVVPDQIYADPSIVRENAGTVTEAVTETKDAGQLDDLALQIKDAGYIN